LKLLRLPEREPRPGRTRKPIGWSMIAIGVLVAVSAALIYRRDGGQTSSKS
jgi:hypothetical protein